MIRIKTAQTIEFSSRLKVSMYLSLLYWLQLNKIMNMSNKEQDFKGFKKVLLSFTPIIKQIS